MCDSFYELSVCLSKLCVCMCMCVCVCVRACRCVPLCACVCVRAFCAYLAAHLLGPDPQCRHCCCSALKQLHVDHVLCMCIVYTCMVCMFIVYFV